MRSVRILIALMFCFAVSAKAEYWQNFVDYQIEVSLDDSEHKLTGHEKLTYYNNSPENIDSLVILLYPNAYRDTTSEFAREIISYHWKRFYFSDESERGWINLENLKVNNQSSSILPCNNHPDVGVIYLDSPLAPGTTVEVEMDFVIKVPIRFSRMLRSGKHYQIVHWYPRMAVYDRRGWRAYPYREMGEFYGEFGNYDVKIKVPANYTVAATGILQNKDEKARLDSLAIIGKEYLGLSKKERKKWRKNKNNQNTGDVDSTKTLHFIQENVIDFAWFADKRFIVQKDSFIYEKSGREIELWTYCLPTVQNKWERSPSYLKTALKYYGEFYGEYPYDALAAVCGPIGSGDGMEYPMISINGDLNNNDLVETVVVHEAGHNWFQAILATDERDFPWMDEGMNTFSERRCFSAEHGDDYIYATPEKMKWATPNMKQHNLSLSLNSAIGNSGRSLESTKPAKDYPSDFIYVNSAFLKPSMLFYLLMEYMGEDKFNLMMQEYYETWKFKHPHPEDFRAIAEKHNNKDINWFFDQALGGDGSVDYVLKIKSKGFDNNQHITSITVEQKGQKNYPVPVSVYHKGQLIEKFWYEGKDEKSDYTIQTDLKPTRLVLDENHYSTDVNSKNNTWPRRFALQPIIDLENPDAQQFFFAPVPFYNFMDGVTASGHLYTFDNTHRNHSIHLSGGYGFLSENPIYRGKYGFKKYDHKNTSLFKSELKTMDNYGHRQHSAGLSLKLFPAYKEEYRYTKFSGEIFMQEFYETGYYDKNSWTTDDLLDIRLTCDYYRRFYLDTVTSKLKVHRGINSGDFVSDYTRLDWRTSWIHRFNLDAYTFFTTYLGWIPDSNNLPLQHRFWASGGVDPYFEELTMFDRSGRTIASPMQHYVNKMGPRVRGYNTFSSDESVALFNTGFIFDQWQVFVDGGYFQDSAFDDEFIMSFGLVYETGPLIWHFPIYKSDPAEGEGHWVDSRSWKERYLVSISLPNIQLAP